ncbi:MAG: M16 family metallopeptidase [Mycobacteriales bacterium]|nr:MAG: peptidase M16 [Pseudonocardiales bacterium]
MPTPTDPLPAATRTLNRGADGGVVRRTILPSGLRVITESMPSARSASFGVWIGVGSRDETPSLAGASHYLEHLLFKGTRRRNALEISGAIDAVGGELNAFTAKEHTCYYADVLACDLPLAVDVVGDVVVDALVAAQDVENERGVILEEIAMRDDDAGDLVHDAFSLALFGDLPLGRPVIGTTDSIARITREQVYGYYRRRYRAPNVVVAAAGCLEHKAVLRLVRKALAPLLDNEAAPAPRRPVGAHAPLSAPASAVSVLDRSFEQANLVLGSRALSRHDQRRFALGVLCAGLGGGASSRLFQEIRERRGLAYSVYSYATQYAETGSFAVYAGCQPGKAAEVLSIIRDLLDDVAVHGLTDEEVTRGKGQVRGGTVLGLEDADARMNRLGKSELAYGEVLPVDELLARIEAITPDDIRSVAADLLTAPRCLAVVGPFGRHDFDDVVAG